MGAEAPESAADAKAMGRSQVRLQYLRRNVRSVMVAVIARYATAKARHDIGDLPPPRMSPILEVALRRLKRLDIDFDVPNVSPLPDGFRDSG